MNIMLIDIPDEVEKYMDFRGGNHAIFSSAPENVKEKAREINRICIEKFGEPFFILPGDNVTEPAQK
jgi:hypothetical protein